MHIDVKVGWGFDLESLQMGHFFRHYHLERFLNRDFVSQNCMIYVQSPQTNAIKLTKIAFIHKILYINFNHEQNELQFACCTSLFEGAHLITGNPVVLHAGPFDKKKS